MRLVTSTDLSNDQDASISTVGNTPSFLADWNALCESFGQATGAQLAFRGPHDPAFPSTAVWETTVPAAGPYAPGTLGLLKSSSNKSSARSGQKIENATALAEQVGSLVRQLHDSHRALWQRNAELATAIPMIVDTHEEAAHLARRFSSLLASAARAAGADTAAMYILDDATRLLQLRAHHGLDDAAFTEPTRELRECPADIEALAGHAIVLEEAADSLCLLPTLVAEADTPPGAAICIPISSATTPLGTLWVFAKDPTNFSDTQVDMVEIVAGRLAAEMEREILLREQGALGNSGRVTDAVEWQQEQLPVRCDMDCGSTRWDLAARAATRSRLHGDFYRWQSQPASKAGKTKSKTTGQHADSLSLILSTSHARGIPAALSAARMGGLIANLPGNDLAQQGSYLNQALWNGSAGDDQASVFLGQLNQATGELVCCAAGLIDVFVIRPHGWEPILQINNAPLGGIDCEVQLSADHRLPIHRCEIQSGDTLLILSGRPRLRACTDVDGQVDGLHYAEAALHHNHLEAEQLGLLLSGLWDHQTSPWAAPPAQLIARRS